VPKQPSGSVVPDAWCGIRYPHGRSVADLADPGYSPVPKSRHPLRVSPDGGRGPLGMPVTGREASERKLISGLAVAPEQRPCSRVSAPRP
jgi:hypothetical protein